ncbi:MAG TPA: hypothetical protein VFG84_01975 [Gemmatimonadaceae bacterium]|nr:hypothetical protein [Gemmatimonadaceae bacterium]
MSKTDNTRKRGAASAPNGAAPDGPPESLDKVRDILFGGQMRAVDARLQGLEERLLSEHEALRDDFAKQLAELKAMGQKETGALDAALAAEREKRSEAIRTLSADFKETLKQLEKRHLKLEETSGVADSELRDQLLAQARAAQADQGRLTERLANLFADLAGKVGGPPEKNSRRS